GSWVLWGGVFFFFASDKAKAVFAKTMWIICGVSVADYMLFGTKLGIISSLLQYDKRPVFELSEYVINLAAIAAVAALFYLICKKLPVVAETVILVGILAVIGIGTINTATVLGVYAWNTKFTRPSTEMPEIPLSRNGKNVVVLMLDRGLGTLVPYIMNEKPELKEQFDGFTYYPNTMSYGTRTFFAAPALFGGYEYTPENLNNRPDEKLVDKHNESLKVLPVLFKDNGYEVTVCDPPYAGYQNIPDLSIYDDYPEFHCYNTRARFNFFEDEADSDNAEQTSAGLVRIRNRNFFCFSLMKISPLVLQATLYDEGMYNEASSDAGVNNTNLDATALVHHIDGLSKSTGYEQVFIEAYPVLTKLPEITSVSDSSENTFLMMSNDTTHSPCLLQEPDYVPALNVDNTAYDVNMTERYTVNGVTMPLNTEYQVIHYHVNMAAFLQVGKWLDYLREQGVYDNTRIIIVSDHGRGLDQFNIKCNGQDMEYFMPLFMVKDFDAKGFTVSDEFMTNADTVTYAT
ncbi:MAG: sulfatase-like hydrolase/transferase, partial [Clostridiales bacterium]|nr:sulfatase-like hydrolase/transferase [Clostridiales bacterium]